MQYRIVYWDSEASEQRERDATPDETAEIDARRVASSTPSSEEYVAAIQAHMDARAREKNYDDIKSAALRAGYPGPFHDEGVACAVWMDTCWAISYAVMADIADGTCSPPTIPALLAAMPPLTWPR